MTELIVVGGISIDHLIYERGEAHFDCLGGPALYASLGALFVPNTKVSVATKLPTGEPEIRRVFEKFGVDTSRSPASEAVERIWILHDKCSRKLIPVRNSSATEIQGATSEPQDEGLSQFLTGNERGTVLLCSPEPGIQLPHATVIIDPHQTYVNDFGIEYFKSFSARRIVFLPSRLQLSILDENVDRAIREISAETGCEIIARLDADGMRVFARDVDLAMKDPLVRVVDTTGAGDSSAGAIAASLAHGDSLEVATEKALRIVRTTLDGWGPESLIRKLEQMNHMKGQ